jgi:hypothetical protein
MLRGGLVLISLLVTGAQVAVGLGVGVFVGVGVIVGVFVGVAVGVLVGVAVQVGVAVRVGVAVLVGVLVGVEVGVKVGVPYSATATDGGTLHDAISITKQRGEREATRSRYHLVHIAHLVDKREAQ